MCGDEKGRVERGGGVLRRGGWRVERGGGVSGLGAKRGGRGSGQTTESPHQRQRLLTSLSTVTGELSCTFSSPKTLSWEIVEAVAGRHGRDPALLPRCESCAAISRAYPIGFRVGRARVVVAVDFSGSG